VAMILKWGKGAGFIKRLSVYYGFSHEFIAKLDVNCMTVATSNAWNRKNVRTSLKYDDVRNGVAGAWVSRVDLRH
jgi:hypothetical protein